MKIERGDHLVEQLNTGARVFLNSPEAMDDLLRGIAQNGVKLMEKAAGYEAIKALCDNGGRVLLGKVPSYVVQHPWNTAEGLGVRLKQQMGLTGELADIPAQALAMMLAEIFAVYDTLEGEAAQETAIEAILADYVQKFLYGEASS